MSPLSIRVRSNKRSRTSYFVFYRQYCAIFVQYHRIFIPYYIIFHTLSSSHSLNTEKSTLQNYLHTMCFEPYHKIIFFHPYRYLQNTDDSISFNLFLLEMISLVPYQSELLSYLTQLNVHVSAAHIFPLPYEQSPMKTIWFPSAFYQ